MPSVHYLNKKVIAFWCCISIFGSLLILSCRKDFEYKTSEGKLEFSQDTVFLDTVFTAIGSSTYSLKVYNRSTKNINIPFIGLENGQESGYRLNVDGLAGKEFNDIPLLARDSLFIFIETTFDITTSGQNEFLYTDAIRFDSANESQKVDLVTLVRDAVFLYPQTVDGMTESLLLGTNSDGNEIRIEGFLLEDSELNFTNEKPYVVYGYAAVPNAKQLIMNPGSRVHFHKDSGILVMNGGSLKANGQLSEDQELLENAIIFEGDRLEPQFADVPGQWGTIWFANGSVENELNHTVIKNATIGMFVEGGTNTDTPTLSVKNSIVSNSSAINLWGRDTQINGENLILGNAGQASLYCNLGGRYNFKHCTIANYWTNSLRNSPSLLIDNFIEFAPNQFSTGELIAANFSNCIINGNRQIELVLMKSDAALFNYNFLNCAIRFNDTNSRFEGDPLYDFQDIAVYQNVLLNTDINFMNTQESDYRLTENSSAINAGNLDTGIMVPLDILENDRTQSPDLGAFEFITQN